MQKISKLFLIALAAVALWSCEDVDDNGVPEGLAVTLGETPVAHGDVVQVSDYNFSFDVTYRKDLIASFEPIGESETYEEQMIEGSRKEFSSVSLDAQSRLTFVTLSRAKNGEEVFQFTVSGPFNQEEAEESIDDLSVAFIQDVVTMVQSDGVLALQQLSDLAMASGGMEPFAKDWTREGVKDLRQKGIPTKKEIVAKAAEFRQVFDVRQSKAFMAKVEDNGLDALAGRLEWNFETEEFELTDSTINILEVLYPSEGSTTNNAAFRLTEYYYAGESTDGTDDLIRVEAEMEVDGDIVLEVSVRAYNSETAGGFESTMFLAPFSYEAYAMYDEATMSASAGESITLGDEVLIGSTLEADLISSQDGGVWASEIRGTQQLRELSLQAAVDVELAEMWDGVSNPDAFVTADVMFEGTSMGDVVWVEELYEGSSEEYWYPYLQLPNEDLVDVLTLIEDEIEEIEAVIIQALEQISA